MDKKQEKLTPGEKSKSDERMWDTIRNEFDFGEGATVSLGSENGKETTISHYFNSRIPKLQIKSKAVKRIIDVELSSVEGENQSLLHFLFKKTSA